MTKQKVSTAAKRNRQRKHNLRRSRIRFTSMMGVTHLMQVNLEAMKKMGCKRIDEVAYLMTETTALIVSNLVKKDGGDPIAFREPFMHGMGMAWDAAVAMITAGESKGKEKPTESENK